MASYLIDRPQVCLHGLRVSAIRLRHPRTLNVEVSLHKVELLLPISRLETYVLIEIQPSVFLFELRIGVTVIGDDLL